MDVGQGGFGAILPTGRQQAVAEATLAGDPVLSLLGPDLELTPFAR